MTSNTTSSYYNPFDGVSSWLCAFSPSGDSMAGELPEDVCLGFAATAPILCTLVLCSPFLLLSTSTLGAPYSPFNTFEQQSGALETQVGRSRYPYRLVAFFSFCAGIIPTGAWIVGDINRGVFVWVLASLISSLVYSIAVIRKRSKKLPMPDYALLWTILISITTIAVAIVVITMNTKGYITTRHQTLVALIALQATAWTIVAAMNSYVLCTGTRKIHSPHDEAYKLVVQSPYRKKRRCCAWKSAAIDPTERSSLLDSSIDLLSARSPTRTVASSTRTPTSPTTPAGKQRIVSPAEAASFFSRLWFVWMNPIMRLGFARPLEASDMPEIPSDDKADVVSSIFMQEWKKTVDNCKPGQVPSLGGALVRAYGSTFAAAGVFKLTFDAVQYIGPLILNAIVQFLEDTQNGLNPPVALGLSYVIILFASSLVQTTLLHQYFFRAFKVGQNVRAALIVAVYDKALRLSLRAKQKLNVGTITNLMSTDAKRLQDLLTYAMTVFSGPWQIALSLTLLWYQIGISVLAGLAVMLLFLPLNGVIARQSQKLQDRLMKIKDQRINLTTEVLQGFRLVKYNGWERFFLRTITDTRDAELVRLRAYLLLAQAADFLWQGLPLIVTLATFGCYTLINGRPPAATNLFTALSLFNMLRFPLSMFPSVISSIVEAQVSLKRLRDHFIAEEIAPNSVHRIGANVHGYQAVDVLMSPMSTASSYNSMMSPVADAMPSSAAVIVQNGTFVWDPDAGSSAFSLSNLNMRINRGDFVAVVGTVGAGKTTLLHAMLGELHKHAGEVYVRGRIAYAAQSPFILNATLRDNVLFGSAYDHVRYNQVLDVCQLRPDLAILPAGDSTEIGEKGINLSGGQQARVALARAVYSDADVYLLDDILSAVDAHVGAKIFTDCILGMLAGKTRVLVTHGLQYISSAHHVMVMQGGKVIEEGSYTTLVGQAKGPVLMSMVESFKADTESLVQSMESAEQTPESPSTAGINVVENKSGTKQNNSSAATKQMAAETQLKGQLSRSVYTEYLKALGGYRVSAFVLFMFVAFQSTSMGASAWLSTWSSDENTPGMTGLGIYAAISIAALLILVALRGYIAIIGVRAAKGLHRRMLERVLYVPLSFIDTTPIGRIINRFSQDVYVVDEQLPDTYSSFISTLMSVLGTVVLISAVTPWFLVALLPLSAFYIYTQRYYVASSRELQRLDSISRSPIFANFSETLAGSVTIRAFGEQQRFITKNKELLQTNQAAYFMYTTSNRWLAVRLESVSTCITGGAALLAVLARNSGGNFPSLAGLSISTALALTQTLNWLVRMASDSESQSVSVERIKEYSELAVEHEPATLRSPPPAWPSRGEISLQHVRLHYRHNTPAVLQDVTCDIAPAEHIGIAGRTGAGKSSLIAALLLTADVVDGTIMIDGVDIKTIPLHELRSRVTLIQQNPLLFSGTLRRNLDMLQEHNDEQIWHALKLVQLKEYVESLPGGLDATVADGGANFSAGQRQLLTVARALLKRSKVVILDEASSSVDVQSDAILQQAIRKEFADSTVLTIAHRINTIVDSDRVMVMDAGKIAEFESPQTALARPDSLFSALVRNSVQAHTS